MSTNKTLTAILAIVLSLGILAGIAGAEPSISGWKMPSPPADYDTEHVESRGRAVAQGGDQISWLFYQQERLGPHRKNEQSFAKNCDKNEQQWHRSNYTALVAQQGFMTRFPGSQINCTDGSGTWVSGTTKGMYSNWREIEDEHTDGYVKTTISFVSNITKMTDGRNYIAFQVTPQKTTIIDAELPDMAQTAQTVLGPEKAVSFHGREIINILNQVYPILVKQYPATHIFMFADSLLTMPSVREIVIQTAIENVASLKKDPEKPKLSPEDERMKKMEERMEQLQRENADLKAQQSQLKKKGGK